MVRRTEVNLYSGILSRGAKGAHQGSPPPPPGLLRTLPHPLSTVGASSGPSRDSGPWGPLGHGRPCVTPAPCPLRGPVHLPSESAALHTAPTKRWCPLPCPATRAGYAWSSDGTSTPPPRSPPWPTFNVTLFPPRALTVVNSFPADASSVPITVQTPGRQGLPWGGGGLCLWVCLPLTCPRLPQCQPLPALAVCLGRESTGLRSGDRFLCM